MFLQRRPPSYLSACELQVEKCALILWKKQYSCCHLPAAEASLLPRPRCCRGLALWMMAEARGFTQDVKWQNTGQLVTECREASFSFYWVLQTLIVKWERGVSERLTDVRRRWRRRVSSSCFPRFCGSGAEEEQRRCGSAGWRGSRWFSPVWWMTHLASGSREGKQTDLVVTVQALVHSAPLLNFTLEWVPIGRKHPNVSWNAPVDRQVCAWFLFCHS